MTSPQIVHPNILIKYAELERQRKDRKTDRYLPDTFGTFYVAATTILLAYAGLLGTAAILVMYAIWLPKTIYKGAFLLRPTKDVAFVLILPMLAIISTFWSDYRAESLKTSMEYTSLILCTVIISKSVRITAFIRGLVMGSTIALTVSLSSNRYGLDPMTGQHTLIGLFGSKNLNGLFAELGIIFALLNCFVRQHIFAKFFFAIVPLGVCLICLYLSKSASSVLTLALTLCVILGVASITKLPRAIRTFTLVAFILSAVSVTIVGMAYDAQNLVLKSVGKDTTLTGRTYLWKEGYKSGLEAPIFGHGYQAFWIPGRPKAEMLWQKFGIRGRIGFHFHNLFIETFVELGAVGIILLAYIMTASCWRSVRLIIRHGLSIEYVYGLAFSFMFLVRAMVEVDIIGTFSIGPLLFFSIVPRLASARRERADSSKQQLPSRISKL